MTSVAVNDASGDGVENDLEDLKDADGLPEILRIFHLGEYGEKGDVAGCGKSARCSEYLNIYGHTISEDDVRDSAKRGVELGMAIEQVVRNRLALGMDSDTNHTDKNCNQNRG